MLSANYFHSNRLACRHNGPCDPRELVGERHMPGLAGSRADGDRSLDRFQMLNENLQSRLGDFWKRRIAFGLLRLWDRGHWEPEGNKTREAALASGDFKFKLQGQRLHGSWILIAMKQAMYGWLSNRCSLRRALSH
jgi:hypothetical protein